MWAQWNRLFKIELLSNMLTIMFNFSNERYFMSWNTVQVVNCTIQNTQAICLWNVKKALNFFLLLSECCCFLGGQTLELEVRNSSHRRRVSRLEKVSKNLLLKKFQSIGSCSIVRVFWYPSLWKWNVFKHYSNFSLVNE